MKYAQQFLGSLYRNLTGLHGQINLAGGTLGVSSFNIVGVDSVVRSGTGELTLVLSRKWPFHLWTKCQVMSATPQDLIPQVESSSLVTAQTCKIRLLTAAVPADPTSACTVYVGIWFRDSSTTK